MVEQRKDGVMNFMGGTLEEWDEEGVSWTGLLRGWKPEEVAELDRRIRAVPPPKSGYWDTILTYDFDMAKAVAEDKEAPEMQDPVMRCVLEYRCEIGK